VGTDARPVADARGGSVEVDDLRSRWQTFLQALPVIDVEASTASGRIGLVDQPDFVA
jgi:hypothetical protein